MSYFSLLFASLTRSCMDNVCDRLQGVSFELSAGLVCASVMQAAHCSYNDMLLSEHWSHGHMYNGQPLMWDKGHEARALSRVSCVLVDCTCIDKIALEISNVNSLQVHQHNCTSSRFWAIFPIAFRVPFSIRPYARPLCLCLTSLSC